MNAINIRNKVFSLVQAACDHKAIDLSVLDVSQHCDYAQFFLIMSATSARHAQALADAMVEVEPGPVGVEGQRLGAWILVDLGPVVVHIFQEPTRAYYNLDKLWGDVPRLDPQALQPKRLSQSSPRS